MLTANSVEMGKSGQTFTQLAKVLFLSATGFIENIANLSIY